MAASSALRLPDIDWPRSALGAPISVQSPRRRASAAAGSVTGNSLIVTPRSCISATFSALSSSWEASDSFHLSERATISFSFASISGLLRIAMRLATISAAISSEIARRSAMLDYVALDVVVLPLPRRMVGQRHHIDMTGFKQLFERGRGTQIGDLIARMDAMVDQQIGLAAG